MNTEELKRKLDDITIKFNQVFSSHKTDLNAEMFQDIDWHIDDDKNTLIMLESLDDFGYNSEKQIKEIEQRIEGFNQQLDAILLGKCGAPISNQELEENAHQMFKKHLINARSVLASAQLIRQHSSQYSALATLESNFLADIEEMKTFRIDKSLSAEDRSKLMTAVWKDRANRLQDRVDEIEPLLRDIMPVCNRYLESVIQCESNLQVAMGQANVAINYLDKDVVLELKGMIDRIERTRTNPDFINTSFEDRISTLMTFSSVLQEKNSYISEKIRESDTIKKFKDIDLLSLINEHEESDRFDDFLFKLGQYLKIKSGYVVDVLIEFNKILSLKSLRIKSENLTKLMVLIEENYTNDKERLSHIDNLIYLSDIFMTEAKVINIDDYYKIYSDEPLSIALSILKENHIQITYKIIDNLLKNPDICQVIIQQNIRNNNDVKKLETKLFGRFLIDFINHSIKKPELAKAMRYVGEKAPEFCQPWLLVYSYFHPQFITILTHEVNFKNNVLILKEIVGKTNKFTVQATGDSNYLSEDDASRNFSKDFIKRHFSKNGKKDPNDLAAESLCCLHSMQNDNRYKQELGVIASNLYKFTEVSVRDDKKEDYAKYCKQIIPLLLNKDKLPLERVKDCEQLAGEIFKHRDATWRAIGDIFQIITLAFLWIMPIRKWGMGKSAFFSTATTSTQDKIFHHLKSFTPNNDVEPNVPLGPSL